MRDVWKLVVLEASAMPEARGWSVDRPGPSLVGGLGTASVQAVTPSPGLKENQQRIGGVLQFVVGGTQAVLDKTRIHQIGPPFRYLVCQRDVFRRAHCLEFTKGRR
jgi:hypothetical protein